MARNKHYFQMCFSISLILLVNSLSRGHSHRCRTDNPKRSLIYHLAAHIAGDFSNADEARPAFSFFWPHAGRQGQAVGLQLMRYDSTDLEHLIYYGPFLLAVLRQQHQGLNPAAALLTRKKRLPNESPPPMMMMVMMASN